MILGKVKQPIMKSLFYSVIILFVLSSCSVEPQPINYGSDACEFCKMTIVDKQHAAELVTNKGKPFKFDAVECMANYLNRNNLEENSMSFLLVCDYDNPGNLIDARKATFIIRDAVPSPMGAFLSAFESKQNAAALVQEKGGEVFDWSKLKQKYDFK